ncbi:MAG: hypothetical protein DWQ31_04620 [Planctomycetota bacterium]|nr:MAG: hypothetical protein DWQ31_04620 [Planctomycetota bacterium]REJ97122.1 MAG: hypothetical protein DWQ35_02585 [Planctomycetota bacterium]
MAELTPEIVDQVVAAVTAGAGEAATALGTALDAEFALSVGEAATFDAASPPAGFDGAALCVLIQAGEVGAVLALPTASGFVPDWCAAPDESQQAKLAALAEGLCEPLFGELIEIDFFQAQQVAHLATALAAGELAADAPLVSLQVSGDDKSATASLLWPLAKPGELFNAAAAAEDSPAAEGATAEATAAAATQTSAPTAAPASGAGGGTLPPYMKSLLRIEIPLAASLATTKKKAAEVLKLGPGSLIQFDKGCDELLELYAGGELIARGEAVKVGEKFGLQIKSMELPKERFIEMRRS